MTKKRVQISIYFLACCFCAALLALPGRASAATTEADLMKKTTANAIKQCWVGETYLKRRVSQPTMAGSLFTKKGKNDKVVVLPTEVGNSVNGSKVTCQQLFVGKIKGGASFGYGSGLSSVRGFDVPNDLDRIGYKEVESPSGYHKQCVKVRFNHNNADYYTNSACFITDKNGKITWNNPDDGGRLSDLVTFEGETVEVTSDKPATEPTASLGPDDTFLTIKVTFGDLGTSAVLKGRLEGKTTQQVVSELKAAINKGTGYSAKEETVDSEEVGKKIATDYERKSSATDTLKFFFGNDATWEGMKWTDEEVFGLYNTYVRKAINDKDAVNPVSIGGSDSCSNKIEDAKKKSSNPEGLAVKQDGKWCPINNVKDYDKRYSMVHMAKNRRGDPLYEGGTLEDVVKALMRDEFKDMDGGDLAGGTQDEDGEGGDMEETSQCHKSGKKIGWIMCSVLEGVADVVEGTYDTIESDFLVIKPGFFATQKADGKTTATYDGWKIFRDMANVIFALLFVIVIFSQLTGFGLDNYGVKKILPRLIMVAILVNISFILCQGAVDVSNILGAGLRNIFEAMIPPTMQNNIFSVDDFVNMIKNDLLLTAGAGVAAYFAVTNWDAWVMPVMLVLVVSVISVIFFFLLLGVRQAGVIVAVVVAPVAIVCYALPNTKKIFDRWYKIFTAFLLVYPIAGLLMGGGKFASTLLININSPQTIGNNGTNGLATVSYDETGFIYNLVAMLISLVPFFFIPKMVQGSMNALGGIGTSIQRMGAKLRGGAQKAVRSSEAYKDLQKRATATGSGQRGFRLMQKQKRLQADGRDLNAFDRVRMRRNLGRYNAQKMEDAYSQINDAKYLKEGTADYNTMMDSVRDETRLKQSKEMTAQYSASGLFDSDENTGAEYERVLREMADPGLDLNSSRGIELQARAMSLQSQLASSKKGVQAMRNAASNVYATTANNGAGNRGLMRAASLLSRSHSGAIKGMDRGFFNMNNDIASGGGASGHFEEFTDSKSGKRVMLNSAYDMASRDSMTASKFADMGDSARFSMSNRLNAIKENAKNKAIDDLAGGTSFLNTLSEPARQAARQAAETAFSTKNTAEQNRLIRNAVSDEDRKTITAYANSAEEMMLNSNISKDAEAIEAANEVRRFDSEIGQTAYIASQSGATGLERARANQRAYELSANDSSDIFKIDHAPEKPASWVKNSNGQYVDTANGSQPLSSDQMEELNQILQAQSRQKSQLRKWNAL